MCIWMGKTEDRKPLVFVCVCVCEKNKTKQQQQRQKKTHTHTHTHTTFTQRQTDRHTHNGYRTYSMRRHGSSAVTHTHTQKIPPFFSPPLHSILFLPLTPKS